MSRSRWAVALRTLLILIACVIIAIVKVFGTTLRSKYERAQEKVDKDVVIP
mgnify:CR=1 FL=1